MLEFMLQLKVFDHGVESNVIPHPHIQELARHSNLVKFLTYVRPIFMHQFNIHREKFQGVNSEAMFVGTVLHSLDHTMAEINLEITEPFSNLRNFSKVFLMKVTNGWSSSDKIFVFSLLETKEDPGQALG